MKKNVITIICFAAAFILCLGLLVSVAAMGRDPENENGSGNIFGDIFDGIVDIFTPEPEPGSVIVAEIYIGDETTPYMQLTRDDVIEKMNANYRYDENGVDANIFSTGNGASREHGILWKSDVRIEILSDIDIGEERLRLDTSNGGRITVNGNGHTIFNNYDHDHLMEVNTYDEGGTVILNDLKLITTCRAVLTSKFDGIILDLNGCELINNRFEPNMYWQNDSGLYITQSGQYNISKGTYIEATEAIVSRTGQSDIEITVNDDAWIAGGLVIDHGTGVDLNFFGRLKTNEDIGKTAYISFRNSVSDVNFTVIDAEIYGSIVSDRVPVMKLESGTIWYDVESTEEDGTMPTITKGEGLVILFSGEE